MTFLFSTESAVQSTDDRVQTEYRVQSTDVLAHPRVAQHAVGQPLGASGRGYRAKTESNPKYGVLSAYHVGRWDAMHVLPYPILGSGIMSEGWVRYVSTRRGKQEWPEK
jgi:hypothetical protein